MFFFDPMKHFNERNKYKIFVSQLKVAWVDDGTKFDPGARIDPEGHDVYEGNFLSYFAIQ